MLLLTLTKEEMAFLTDISRTIIPLFAAMGGAMTGSYLTYRFQKRDKIRDHLFTYKVKAYSTLAECIVGVKRDMESKRAKIRVQREEDAKSISDIWDEFRKVSDEQALFSSDNTKRDLLILEHIIFQSYTMEIERILQKDSFSDNDMIIICDRIISDCDDFITKLQNEIGVNIVNPKLNLRKINKNNQEYF